ncbi:MAG: hypothetical protein RMY28_031105 [Nostoc sp. ChiSLP01]|nr:hypothetical protein [Nostoc sp. CmiSLP01]MDZ8288414.1 hypothetical protein [Nostoc sp. ChiSLP01]
MNTRNNIVLLAILGFTILGTAALTTAINRSAFREGNIDDQRYKSTDQPSVDVPLQSGVSDPNVKETQGIKENIQYTNNVCEGGPLSQEPGIENDLGSQGFISYQWLRPGNKEPLYQSTLFMTSKGNKLCLYQSAYQDPFGSLALCGGLGCDLKRGELVSILEFKPSNDGKLVVHSTTGSASFLRGAVCQIDADYVPTLVCRSSQSPSRQVQGDAIIVFAPAS